MTPEEFKQKHDDYFKDYANDVSLKFYNNMIDRFDQIVSEKTFLDSRKYEFIATHDELKYADRVLRFVKEKGWDICLTRTNMYDPDYFLVFVD
jgi:hypothetical protein